MLDEPQRSIGRANRRADHEAKQAILLHPQASQNEWDDVKSSIERVEMVARSLANVLPLFPKATHTRPPRRAKKQRVFKRAGGWHTWDTWLWGQ
eukprot:6358073-Pyramimonas_sp.AAC.1